MPEATLRELTRSALAYIERQHMTLPCIARERVLPKGCWEEICGAVTPPKILFDPRPDLTKLEPGWYTAFDGRWAHWLKGPNSACGTRLSNGVRPAEDNHPKCWRCIDVLNRREPSEIAVPNR